MKYYLYSKSCYLIVAFIILSISSCSDMNELHDKYLQKGEIIYVGRPDSVKVFSGRDRILMRYWSSDPKAKKMIIYWQLRKDSLLTSIPEQEDSVDLIISNLPENNYNFELVTMKEDLTCRSVPLLANGSTYGDKFQAAIKNRLIKSAKLISTNEVEIVWYGASEGELGNEISYSNSEGVVVSIFQLSDEEMTNIHDYEDGLKFRTLYLPEPNAIDTFYTSYQDVILEYPEETPSTTF